MWIKFTVSNPKPNNKERQNETSNISYDCVFPAGWVTQPATCTRSISLPPTPPPGIVTETQTSDGKIFSSSAFFAAPSGLRTSDPRFAGEALLYIQNFNYTEGYGDSWLTTNTNNDFDVCANANAFYINFAFVSGIPDAYVCKTSHTQNDRKRSLILSGGHGCQYVDFFRTGKMASVYTQHKFRRQNNGNEWFGNGHLRVDFGCA